MASDDPSDNPNDKKDLTGMFSLPEITPSKQDAEPEFPQETVESFESMAPDLSLPEPDLTKPLFSEAGPEPESPTSMSEVPPLEEFASPSPALDPLDDLRQYSQSVQGTSQMVPIFVPYHLYLSGTFGPYERDKLLLFITENEIGVSSQDLDLQIRAGRVFFPRISEFAGIKLIQELRDSGLKFRFLPAERDTDEGAHPTPGLEFHYQPSTESNPRTQTPIPVIPEGSKHLAEYEELDTILLNQYLKAEVVEAERSELFQEVVDRMLESLKQKARIKGGDALGNYTQKITPLRLPSQYQITLQATLLKKRP